jgi:hypothetical protein
MFGRFAATVINLAWFSLADKRGQEASNYPDWGKMNFKAFPARSWEELLPGASPEMRSLTEKLVVYETGKRLTALEVRNIN